MPRSGDLNSPGVGEFETMDYVHVEADVTPVPEFPPAERVGGTDGRPRGSTWEADYLPVSKKNIDKMYEELLGFIASVKNPHLNQLLSKFFVESPAFAKGLQVPFRG